MKVYSKAFREAQTEVFLLEEKLKKAQARLQDVCPHVYLNGRSAIPNGISHENCRICGMSTYGMGRYRRAK